MPGMHPLENLRVKIFADGADAATMIELCANPLIKGFTTNPTVMRAAGVTHYERFARRVLEGIGERPISFEIFGDEPDEMERQARTIASWPGNVYVKVPVTNTKGESTTDLLHRLTADGIKVNVTALMTLEQIASAREALGKDVPAYVSLFAGRIADAGIDPVPLARQALKILQGHANIELVWASPRELLNVFHAESAGCHVVTLTTDLLAKLPLVGKSLQEFSLDTVKMFHRDALAANLTL